MNHITRTIMLILGGAVMLGWLCSEVLSTRDKLASLEAQLQETTKQWEMALDAKTAALHELAQSEQARLTLADELERLRQSYDQGLAANQRLLAENSSLREQVAQFGLRPEPTVAGRINLHGPLAWLAWLTIASPVLLGGGLIVWRRNAYGVRLWSSRSTDQRPMRDRAYVLMTREEIRSWLVRQRRVSPPELKGGRGLQPPLKPGGGAGAQN